MSDSIEHKLKALGGWLFKNKCSDEYCETMLLKKAISAEDAKSTLMNSRRIPKVLKGLLWEGKIEYDEADLKYLSSLYRGQMLEYVPSDIASEDKALSMKWLTTLGSYDKAFASNAILSAIEEEGDTGAWVVTKLRDYLEEEWSHMLREHSLHIKNKIERFFLQKKFMKIKDIMFIKSLSQFSSIIEEAKDKIEENEDKLKWEDAEKGTTFMQTSDPQLAEKWEVIRLSNKGAARYWGKKTEWCTAADGCAFRDYYHPKDPIFIIQHKYDKEERYQVHYGTMQFKDTQDGDLSDLDKEVFSSILDRFGANEHLSSQVYKHLQAFKGRDYSEKEFFEIVLKIEEFINDVVFDKLNTDGVMGQGEASLDGSFFQELEAQIEDDLIIGYDSKISDQAAKLVAEYRPASFFDLSLDADYPELINDILLNYFNKDNKAAILAKAGGHSLNLYSLFKEGTLFDNDSTNEILKSSKEIRKGLVDALVREHGQELMLKKDTISPEGEALIAEFYPNVQDYLVNSLVRLSDSTSPYSRIFAYKLGAGTLDVDSLIDSEFYLRFPNQFKNILEETISLLSEGKDKIPVWGISGLLDSMVRKGIVSKYFNYYIALLKIGLKEDYDKFSRFASPSKYPNINSEMLEEVTSVTEEGEMLHVEALLAETNKVYPHWKSDGVTALELFDIFQATNDTYKKPNNPLHKPIVEFYKKILSSLREKLSNTAYETNSGGGRIKIEIPSDILYYIATFFPGLWSTYNLEFKALVSDEAKLRSKESMNKLERAMQENRSPQTKPKEDEDDWDEDEDDDNY